jgi:hypothetical protein
LKNALNNEDDCTPKSFSPLKNGRDGVEFSKRQKNKRTSPHIAMNIKDFAPAIKEKAEEAFEERKTISEKAAATAKGVCDRSFGLGTYDELLKAAASVLEEPQSDSGRIYDNGSVRAEAIGSKDPERTPGTLILSVGSKKCKAVVGELEGDFPRIDSNDAVALAS